MLDWISVLCLLLSCCDWYAHHLLVHFHSLHSLFPFALWLFGIICICCVLGSWFTKNTLWPFFTGPFITIFRISYNTYHVRNFVLAISSLGERWIYVWQQFCSTVEPVLMNSWKTVPGIPYIVPNTSVFLQNAVNLASLSRKISRKSAW